MSDIATLAKELASTTALTLAEATKMLTTLEESGLSGQDAVTASRYFLRRIIPPFDSDSIRVAAILGKA